MVEPCCHRFTAAEGGARLAATAAVRNTLVTECGAFISTRLLHEEAYNIRGLLSNGRQRSVRICRSVNVKPDAYELRILTDLKVTEARTFEDVDDWALELEVKEVLVCTSEVLKRILEMGTLTMSQINVLIIDSCHLIYKDQNLQYIMKIYKQSPDDRRPRILAMTYPLFGSIKKDTDNAEPTENTTDNMQICEKTAIDNTNTVGEKAIDNVESDKKTTEHVEELGVYENLDDFDMYEKLEWRIDQLESELCCKMDLAEDIDGCKRISGTVSKPKELIIEYCERPPQEQLPQDYADLDSFMRTHAEDTLDFLNDHRHDPTEIYGDELYEEFKSIPDPTIEPKQIFNEFLYVLDELGPYAADKAAFNLLVKLEKSKIKVPYERHFLLLRLCTTVLVKIRCYADAMFSKHSSDWDKIRVFSTPKLLRFFEILELFAPRETTNSIDIDEKLHESPERWGRGDAKTNTIKLLEELQQCDFNALGNKIEDRLNAFEADLKDLDGGAARDVESANKDGDAGRAGRAGARRGARGRARGGRGARGAPPPAAGALCGLVFVRPHLLPRILFMLCADASRCAAPLRWLRAQYCSAEPCADRRRQGRRHEDVLKKFRMHECNLLLTTSALEEGIDLPRCNLVLRWDVPASYRSYGLCRSRARAPRAAAAVLAGGRAAPVLRYLATYATLDQLITRKCGCGIQDEPPPEEEAHADTFTPLVQAYTPTAHTHTPAHTCTCNHKAEKDLENRLRKMNITVKTDAAEADDVSGEVKTMESAPNLRDAKTIECVSNLRDAKTIDSVENLIDSTTIVGKSSEVKANEATDVVTIESVPNLSSDITGSVPKISLFLDNVSKIVESVSKSVDSVSKSVDSVSKSIESVSEKIDSIDGDIKGIEIDNQIQSVLSSNVKISNRSSDTDNDSDVIKDSDTASDNRCPCVSDGSQLDSKKDEIASVDLSTAIALINRYCAKLPSDTFTRLAPQWWTERVRIPGASEDSYICTLRLPLNCPLKYNIVGHPMPSRVLARRMVALQACRVLHKSGELDNQLMPIGKENFKAAELELSNAFNAAGNVERDEDDSARPGTTKRRQYYHKRTAAAFTDCQPVIDASDSDIDTPGDGNVKKKDCKDTGGKRNMLYAIESSLHCALPERYNTRGRRLHAPQHARQALGILMARTDDDELQVPPFPVYTRSGEVRVRLRRAPRADVRLSPARARRVTGFMQFVFTDVLRVRRRGMKLQPEGSTKNNFYIVPTIKIQNEDGTTRTDIDWPFLQLIYQHTEEKRLLSDVEKPLTWHQDEEGPAAVEGAGEGESEQPGDRLKSPLLKDGEIFVFDVDKYSEAVVTPWYRNRDQPQFFLVAEICWQLSPDSAFPSESHATFRSYYGRKYRAQLTQARQPLLDVDHTSARLNLLTPRYVNRKGVALPVSSERTRRAKRDRLDQKQILVPELCRVHPFAAPLWFATVALPCVLYRINALLIADEIRRAVAVEVGLGLPGVEPGFSWPPLDFGWSLAEVLNADAEKNEKKKEEEKEKEEEREKEREREQKDKEIRDEEVKQKGVEGATEDLEGDAGAGPDTEAREKTINDILAETEDTESGFEIGTWSNDMASSIPEPPDYLDPRGPLPPNITFCTSASGGVNWCDPIQKKNEFNPGRYSVADSDCSYTSSDFDTEDSEPDHDGSDDDTSGFCSSRTSNSAVGVRIEYKTAHEAEAVDVERKRKSHPAPERDARAELEDRRELMELLKSGQPDEQYVEKFKRSVEKHKADIISKGNLIKKDTAIDNLLPEPPETTDNNTKVTTPIENKLQEIFPFKSEINIVDGRISLESIEKNKRVVLAKLKRSMPEEQIKKLNCFSMVDVDIDSPNYVNEKVMNVGFDSKEKYVEKVLNYKKREFQPYYHDNRGQNGKEFDFDYQPDLEGHPGPSPSVILQALTMSNANDGINLERLETIGDSFLKFAITAYLYCAHPTVHEGKLSHMRSKQVSNLNLYRLGRARRLGPRMVASKFEPHDNWLPPCHRPPSDPPCHRPPTDPPCHRPPTDPPHTEPQQDNREAATGCYIPYNLITQHSIPDKSIADCVEALIGAYLLECGPRGALLFMSWLGIHVLPAHTVRGHSPHDVRGHSPHESPPRAPPRPRPRERAASASSSCAECSDDSQDGQPGGGPAGAGGPGGPAGAGGPGGPAGAGGPAGFVGPLGARRPQRGPGGEWTQVIYGELKAPPSPLLRYISDPEGELEQMLSGYESLEATLQYRFKDRSLLLQALTHASHHRNRLTDCYQRLEFLGDAILDYLITRHLFEDPRRHCPGALTDLRSALVNNTIFATLAVRHGFHKYFRHMSPGLDEVLTKYVKIQEENGHSISEEHYLIQEDELEQAEDVEVPKALGDLFESVAGAIFLDSGMSLGAVWRSYVRLMGAELEAFSAAAPKSPVRELLEAEPDTAKFGKPERLADGRRVRVCVEVFGRGTFKGVGRNYRIAKGTAARCALRHLRGHR